ncbi:Protein S100-A1 [Dissostichus eleginoides]|nr:Protein S100-A1 [Dissostichus eleginoides]
MKLNAADPSATDQLMSSLDKNNDGELNFKESWQLIGHLPNKHGRETPLLFNLPSPLLSRSVYLKILQDMESAIKTVVTTFLSSTKGKENLNGGGFQKLVKNHLGGLMQDTNCSSAVKEMQSGLDANNDGKVSFQEYLTLIGYLASSLNVVLLILLITRSCLLSAPDLQAITRPPFRMSLPNSENASTLENAMQLLIQTFHKYSGNEGDKYTLSRAELKEMLTTELGNYLGNAQDKEAVDRVMGDLDSNNDGEVDFTEFIILVGALTVACNDFFLEFNDKPTKK